MSQEKVFRTTAISTPEVERAPLPDNPDYHRIFPEDEKTVSNLKDIEKVLSDLTFAPSCVDMGWSWEVEAIFTKEFNELSNSYEFNTAGYRLRTTFARPDRESGKISVGDGRWWEVPKNATESAVVKTAFAACKLILEHELMESFKWKNARPFDPHNTVLELAQIAGARYTRTIP